MRPASPLGAAATGLLAAFPCALPGPFARSAPASLGTGLAALVTVAADPSDTASFAAVFFPVVSFAAASGTAASRETASCDAASLPPAGSGFRPCSSMAAPVAGVSPTPIGVAPSLWATAGCSVASRLACCARTASANPTGSVGPGTLCAATWKTPASFAVASIIPGTACCAAAVNGAVCCASAAKLLRAGRLPVSRSDPLALPEAGVETFFAPAAVAADTPAPCWASDNAVPSRASAAKLIRWKSLSIFIRSVPLALSGTTPLFPALSPAVCCGVGAPRASNRASARLRGWDALPEGSWLAARSA